MITLHKELETVKSLASRLPRPAKIMEVCGTHTMAVFQAGLQALLPENLSLLAGPGCPVCVTPTRYLDKALAMARQPDTVITTFGDMLRVPGSAGSLETARADGCDIRVVYSPADALELARRSPGIRVIFLGVGFETTVPAVAWTIREADRTGVTNYLVLSGHKTMPNAMSSLLHDPELAVDGFLCPGHVSAIIGASPYAPLSEHYGSPCVIAGFQPQDIVVALRLLLSQLVAGEARVEIQYTRAVTWEGNKAAQAMINTVFEGSDAEWRGIGTIPESGLTIKDEFAGHDAERVFCNIQIPPAREVSSCRCGDVLKGICAPPDCPLFEKHCTPSNPVGPCMVSSEGTCAAYYKFTT
ncbi:MAG: hydrogenase formation protein HypD [Verrucomicrobiota bacterium]